MKRGLVLSVVVLMAGLLVAAGLVPATAGGALAEPTETPHSVFAPYVLNQEPPVPVEVVVTRRGEDIGYPSYYYVSGYVRSQLDEPLYDVILEVDVTIHAYDPEGGNSPSYSTEKVRISPALTATLPYQINPFHNGLSLGKASASIGEVRALAASRGQPGGEVYYPLTVVDWVFTDGFLSGTLRNDSGYRLDKARLVVAELTKCSWQEAELEATTLEPGQETLFRLGYWEYCLDENLEMVGQGAARP